MVFPLLIVPFVAWGIRDGMRDMQRTQESNYSHPRQDTAILEPPAPTPEPQYQTQSSGSEALLECPPLYVPDQYAQNLDSALDVIHRCGVWNDFCRVTSEVKHNPSAPTAQMSSPNALSNRNFPAGEQCSMQIGTEFLGFRPENLAFAMLHEIYHGIRIYQGKPYGRVNEENDCNHFADRKLKAAGYEHGFRIHPDGTVSTQSGAMFGIRGKKSNNWKFYKL